MNKVVVDLPVATGQWQIKQPLLSIDTQFKSHDDASNGGQHSVLQNHPRIALLLFHLKLKNQFKNASVKTLVNINDASGLPEFTQYFGGVRIVLCFVFLVLCICHVSTCSCSRDCPVCRLSPFVRPLSLLEVMIVTLIPPKLFILNIINKYNEYSNCKFTCCGRTLTF